MAIADVSDRSITELVSLVGKRAVVTGGASGLGAGIARRLAEAGASVVVADLDLPKAEVTAAEIGGDALHVDVSQSASVSTLADTVVQRRGGVDIWVNNAGIFPSRPLLEMDDDEWDHVLAVNLRGTFAGSREAARRMVAGGNAGVIVNVASVAGLRGRSTGIPHYVASKHGVVGLTRQLAIELAPHGIRVMGVAPALTQTDGVIAASHGRTDFTTSPRGPLGRVGVPDDVARVALFCASDLSMFMSGTTLPVDGGELAR